MKVAIPNRLRLPSKEDVGSKYLDGVLDQPSGHQVIFVRPRPRGLSQYCWASSPSYSLVVVELLDSQSELLLVELLLLPRVLLPSTLEDLYVLLIRHFGVFRGELEVLLECLL